MKTKKIYTTPTLKTFGTVRNLTGGSGGHGADGLGEKVVMDMRGW